MDFNNLDQGDDIEVYYRGEWIPANFEYYDEEWYNVDVTLPNGNGVEVDEEYCRMPTETSSPKYVPASVALAEAEAAFQASKTITSSQFDSAELALEAAQMQNGSDMDIEKAYQNAMNMPIQSAQHVSALADLIAIGVL